MSTVIGWTAGGLRFSEAGTRGGGLLITGRTSGYITERQPGALPGVEE